jgi:hypothetical protein
MKNTKMLFLLVGAVMSAALNGGYVIKEDNICHEPLNEARLDATKKQASFKYNNVMQKAAHSLYDAIDNCDKADDKHDSRINEYINNCRNLSLSQFKDVLDSQYRFARSKDGHYKCDNCEQLAIYISIMDADAHNSTYGKKKDILVKNYDFFPKLK